jgi:hypothetical protein
MFHVFGICTDLHLNRRSIQNIKNVRRYDRASSEDLRLVRLYYFKKDCSMAELTKVSAVLPRELGSNLGKDRKYFLNLFVSHLNSNL